MSYLLFAKVPTSLSLSRSRPVAVSFCHLAGNGTKLFISREAASRCLSRTRTSHTPILAAKTLFTYKPSISSGKTTGPHSQCYKYIFIPRQQLKKYNYLSARRFQSPLPVRKPTFGWTANGWIRILGMSGQIWRLEGATCDRYLVVSHGDPERQCWGTGSDRYLCILLEHIISEVSRCHDTTIE